MTKLIPYFIVGFVFIFNNLVLFTFFTLSKIFIIIWVDVETIFGVFNS